MLNGGEVAALAVIEAVVRLLPGFMGNAESLTEESHADGLLEYPVYTKPATWRGHDVPEVLLSGDHARIAAWRHAESVRRTAERRPDLAHPSTAVDLGGLAAELRLAVPADAGELLTLQRACWVQEQHGQPRRRHPGAARVARRRAGVDAGVGDAGRCASAGRLVGAVRGRSRGRPLGHRPGDGRPRPAGPRARAGCCSGAIEDAAPRRACTGYVLFTGAGSDRATMRMYQKAGYRLRPEASPAGPLAKRATRLTDEASRRAGLRGRRRLVRVGPRSGAARPTRVRLDPKSLLGPAAAVTCHRGRTDRHSTLATIRRTTTIRG